MVPCRDAHLVDEKRERFVGVHVGDGRSHSDDNAGVDRDDEKVAGVVEVLCRQIEANRIVENVRIGALENRDIR